MKSAAICPKSQHTRDDERLHLQAFEVHGEVEDVSIDVPVGGQCSDSRACDEGEQIQSQIHFALTTLY